MIHVTKRFYAMIFAICCMSNIMQSNDMRDEHGRTKLMNYVIEQEKEITSKRSELQKLWNTYFYTKIVPINIIDASGKATSFYDITTLRKIYTTDADVVHYKEFEDKYKLFIQDTIEDIKSMVFNGANLQARDLQGKSVIDYCYSYEIYDVLRALGAPSTLFEAQCIRFVYGLCGVTALTISTIIAAACYEAYFSR